MCGRRTMRQIDPCFIGPVPMLNVVCFQVDGPAPDLKFVESIFRRVPTTVLALECFENISDKFLAIMKKYSKEVTSVYFTDVFADISETFQCFPNLKTLGMQGAIGGMLQFDVLPLDLTELWLVNAFFTDQNALQLADCCQKLKTLRVDNTSLLRGNGLRYLALTMASREESLIVLSPPRQVHCNDISFGTHSAVMAWGPKPYCLTTFNHLRLYFLHYVTCHPLQPPVSDDDDSEMDDDDDDDETSSLDDDETSSDDSDVMEE